MVSFYKVVKSVIELIVVVILILLLYVELSQTTNVSWLYFRFFIYTSLFPVLGLILLYDITSNED